MGVGVRAGYVVDDVDAVSRVEHVPVVGNLLQDLRCRVTIDDDAENLFINIFKTFSCNSQMLSDRTTHKMDIISRHSISAFLNQRVVRAG